MNYLGRIGTSIIVGCAIALSSATASAFSLPFDQISDPYCEKGVHWSALADECKIAFELPDMSVFSSAENSREKLQFSVLYKASYQDGHQTEGGHPGVDIVSAEGTPLLSIADGKVISSEYKNGYGNTVVIESTSTGERLFFNYAHMEKRLVQEGDIVLEGQHIGTLGRTGFVIGKRGYHLELQITKANAPIHPYSHTKCEVGYMEAVATGVCNNDLDIYTLDPLVRLHQSVSPRHDELYISPLAKKVELYTEREVENNYDQILLEEIMIPMLARKKEQAEKVNTDIDTISNDIKTKKQKNEGEGEQTVAKEIITPIDYSSNTQITAQQKDGSFDLQGLQGSRHVTTSSRVGYSSLVIDISENSIPYTGILPEAVQITLDPSIYSSYISSIKSIRNGSKTILLKNL